MQNFGVSIKFGLGVGSGHFCSPPPHVKCVDQYQVHQWSTCYMQKKSPLCTFFEMTRCTKMLILLHFMLKFVAF